MDGQNQNILDMPVNNSQAPDPYRNLGYGQTPDRGAAPLNPIEHPADGGQPNPQYAPPQPAPMPQTDPQFRTTPAPMANQDISPKRPTQYQSPPPAQPAPTYSQPSPFPAAAPPVSRPMSNTVPAETKDTTSAKKKKFALPAKLKSPKLLIAVGAVLILIVGGMMLLKNMSSNMKTFSIKNGNYTYSFKYYSTATHTEIGGQNSYSYTNKTGKIIASVQPTEESPVTSCAKLGAKWQQVSSVTIEGNQHPVCLASTGNVKAYDVIFSAQNSNHLFLITTYDDPGADSSNSALNAIFGSVRV